MISRPSKKRLVGERLDAFRPLSANALRYGCLMRASGLGGLCVGPSITSSRSGLRSTSLPATLNDNPQANNHEPTINTRKSV